MLACNVLTVDEAYHAINFDTILLLFGMMIVVANLRLSRFFAVVASWVVLFPMPAVGAGKVKT